MIRRMGVLLLLPVLLLCAVPWTASAEETAPVVISADVKAGEEEGIWIVTYSITFAPDTYVWNGDFDICWDTERLEMQGKAETLDLIKQFGGVMKTAKADELHIAFVKAGYDPGTYPITAVTYKQTGSESGTVWIEGIKVEDVGASGREEAKDYAKIAGGLQAPGWEGAAKVTVGADRPDTPRDEATPGIEWWVWALLGVAAASVAGGAFITWRKMRRAKGKS